MIYGLHDHSSTKVMLYLVNPPTMIKRVYRFKPNSSFVLYTSPMTLSLAICSPAYSILEDISDMPSLILSFGNNYIRPLDDLMARTFCSVKKTYMQQYLHQRRTSSHHWCERKQTMITIDCRNIV